MRRCLPFAGFALLLTGLACTPPSFSEAGRVRLHLAALEQGNKRFAQGDYEKAERDFRRAVDYRSDSAQAHNMLGMALLRQRMHTPAMASFTEALRLDPRYAPALCNIGAIHASEQRYAQAKEALLKAIELKPDMAAAYYSLGSLQILTGDEAGGRTNLMRSFELNPDFITTAPRTSLRVASGDIPPIDVSLAFARVFATSGGNGEVVHYLERAKRAGFKEWKTLLEEKAFENVREDPRIIALVR